MELIEVTFKPTDAMPMYQGTVLVSEPGDKIVKPLVVLKQGGTYKLPRAKVAQLVHDFPENFTSPETLDWTDHQISGGTIHLEPGEGLPVGRKSGAAPTHDRAAKAPGKDK